MTAVEAVRIEVSADQSEAWTYCSQIDYDSFNRLGEMLRLDKVTRMIEAGRVLPIMKGFLDFRDPTVVNADLGVFSLGAQYRFDPALWTVRRGSGFPYVIHTKLMDMGKSSATLHLKFINTLDQKELATANFKYVHTNKKTERSEPFPEWLLNKYKAVLTTKQPLKINTALPQISANAYRYDVTVAESDVDHNQHTNQASYIRYCCDAVNTAVRDGHLKKLEPGISFFPLLEVNPVYLSQSWWGDKLQVLVWSEPSETKDSVVHIVIKRHKTDENWTAIFHSSMVFGQNMMSHL